MERPRFLDKIQKQLQVHPSCALLGPRQCGKTTLARTYAALPDQGFEEVHHFDLENPEDLLALSQQPIRVLERLTGLIIIDEIQRLPNLFPILRVLIDQQINISDKKSPQRKYLILGSASRDLIQQSSETLAGRIGYIELTPFQLFEGCNLHQLLIRGGYPLSYLAESTENSQLWRESYIQTFLERDIPNLGFSVPPLLLRRFWMMLTHVNAQLLNLTQLGTSLGISGHSVRQYLDILGGTFMVRLLPPWFENIQKRQIKTPKLFFRDSGILLSLLGIFSEEALFRHPYLGAVWESFALEQVLQTLSLRTEDAFFWRTQHGAELDLLTFQNGVRVGFEFKFSDSPGTSKSMHAALQDLKLDHLYVIYPGKKIIPLQDRITVIGLEMWVNEQKGLM